MKLKHLLFLLLFCLNGDAVFSQIQRNTKLENIVRTDVADFKLSKADLKLYRKGRTGRTSDYFKPKAADVSDTSLLADSAYVKMYRNIAYNKTSLRKGFVEYLTLSAAAALFTVITVVIAL
ncbi:hypothetical protein [Pedobacter sandarakinus]|uniref:hypothetical protein n=1 Tax=Pedobacter sandarakinus TaxID=353156 RepID=UPI00224544C9|nr:hypothetical protein [Pedobacter sandarakinus]MCX2575401.1 hypothetical protein [Pedobacter sandarakinus]